MLQNALCTYATTTVNYGRKYNPNTVSLYGRMLCAPMRHALKRVSVRMFYDGVLGVLVSREASGKSNNGAFTKTEPARILAA